MNSFFSPTRVTLIFLVLSILVVGFIFGNSLKDGEASHRDSDGLVALVKPIIDPQDRISQEDFSYAVRKLAHLTEFCALGICISGVIYGIRAETGRMHMGSALFVVLAVAVADEFIQSFTGRTSAVLDVLIDFSGALGGFWAAWCAVRLFASAKHRKAKRSADRR